jgi:hypothetical protein
MAAHLEIVYGLTHRHGGRPVKLLGDGVMPTSPDPAQRCPLWLGRTVPLKGS